MATVRIIVTLKPGVLDAQGQAVLQGLHALGHQQVADVKVGRYLELTVPDHAAAEEINALCERFLANPLIEEWRLDDGGGREAIGTRRPSRSGTSALPRSGGAH